MVRIQEQAKTRAALLKTFRLSRQGDLEAVGVSDKAVAALRLHTRTGRPLRSDAFLSKVETRLGYRIPIRGRGRPKGSKNKISMKRNPQRRP